MSVTTPVSTWIFAIVLLGVVPAGFFYMLLEPWLALRRDRRDILSRGQVGIGTVVAIDQVYPTGRYGSRYLVTVEFTPPGYAEPVRFQINYGSSEVNKLGVYQQVPIHYRVQTPMEAVIDEFVK
jgi:hypothetical protein